MQITSNKVLPKKEAVIIGPSGDGRKPRLNLRNQERCKIAATIRLRLSGVGPTRSHSGGAFACNGRYGFCNKKMASQQRLRKIFFQIKSTR
ncbi:Uncharacterised protein [Salmonella enterica subsp. enterica]|nr:Uncharacterised protein [Salmonella enterica subsp. enterica]